jgi:hypothetical protein
MSSEFWFCAGFLVGVVWTTLVWYQTEKNGKRYDR